ncbi:hypothetical protein ACH5RR_002350 [Cinchona calisaya]|uniref:CBS domain-containing protein n=1 Tax=Cinchona calisaya TaxID=153742 RepID=A0ABD3B7C5_9GENT
MYAFSSIMFENEQAVQIYGDQSVAEAIHVLWENRIGSVAVIEPETERLIASLRSSDVHLLLEDDELYSNRKKMKVKDFIQLDANKGESNATADELTALPSERALSLRNNLLPRMISPVTNRKSDTLKKAMKDFAETETSFSFLVDEHGRVEGLITLKDVILQFSPPCMDSRYDGGGFFESALEQTGFHVSGGAIVPDQKHTS